LHLAAGAAALRFAPHTARALGRVWTILASETSENPRDGRPPPQLGEPEALDVGPVDPGERRRLRDIAQSSHDLDA